MKKQTVPTKKRVDVALMAFLAPFKPGEKLSTDDCINYVRKNVTRRIRDETITRYLRYLREDGHINYTVFDNQSREMEILHSL